VADPVVVGNPLGNYPYRDGGGPGVGGHTGDVWQVANGKDMYAPPGTPVYSAFDGTVTRVDISKINVSEGSVFGAKVYVTSDDGRLTAYYTHVDRLDVQKGDHVNRGDPLGHVTYWKGGDSHLHFATVENEGKRNQRDVDPEGFLKATKGSKEGRDIDLKPDGSYKVGPSLPDPPESPADANYVDPAGFDRRAPEPPPPPNRSPSPDEANYSGPSGEPEVRPPPEPPPPPRPNYDDPSGTPRYVPPPPSSPDAAPAPSGDASYQPPPGQQPDWSEPSSPAPAWDSSAPFTPGPPPPDAPPDRSPSSGDPAPAPAPRDGGVPDAPQPRSDGDGPSDGGPRDEGPAHGVPSPPEPAKDPADPDGGPPDYGYDYSVGER
jgi:hypothetical protein